MQDVQSQKKQAFAVLFRKKRDSGNQPRVREAEFPTRFRTTAMANCQAHIASARFLERPQSAENRVIVDARYQRAALGHELKMAAGQFKGANELTARIEMSQNAVVVDAIAQDILRT